MSTIDQREYWNGKSEESIVGPLPVFKCNRCGIELEYYVVTGGALPPDMFEDPENDYHLCSYCVERAYWNYNRVNNLTGVFDEYVKLVHGGNLKKAWQDLKGALRYLESVRAMILDPRSKVTAKLRKQLIREADHVCYLCKKKHPTKDLEIEHKIPVSRGGTSDPGNLAVACKTCNAAKGTMTEKEFRRSQKFFVETAKEC